MIWILVGYMWLFMHRPFEIWPILATIRVERVYMIFTLIAWFSFSAKTWTNNRSSGAILLIAFSILFATLISPYMGLGENLETENWFKIFVFFLLIMTSVKTEKDLRILVTAFIVCFGLYMVHSYREYLCGRYTYDAQIKRMIGVDSTLGYANSFASSICYTLPFILPAMTYWNKLWCKFLFLGYFLLSAWCVFLTGSRSGFVIFMIILALGVCLTKYKVRVLVLLLVCSPFVWTILPESSKLRISSLFYGEYRTDHVYGEQGDSVWGQRGEGFWVGMEVMLDNPLGVGPGTGRYVPKQGGFEYHNFFGQVMGDLGFPGVVAYSFLVFSVFLNHFEAGRHYKNLTERKYGGKDVLYLYRISLAATVGIMLLLINGWGGHNAYRFNWVWFAAFQAIAIAFLRNRVDAMNLASLRRRSDIYRPQAA